MRAFVRLREIMSTHKDLARKLAELERKLGEHDEKFAVVFDATRRSPRPPVGHHVPMVDRAGEGQGVDC
jgi:hypothetical protein